MHITELNKDSISKLNIQLKKLGKEQQSNPPHQKLNNKGNFKTKVAQLCLTICNPVDCIPPGFSVHGILQARILEWVAISCSRKKNQREINKLQKRNNRKTTKLGFFEK